MPERSNVVSIWKYSKAEPANDQEGDLYCPVQAAPLPPSAPHPTDVAVLKWYQRKWFRRMKCQRHCKSTRQNISWMECVCFIFLSIIACFMPVLVSWALFPRILGPVFVWANVQFLAGFLLLVYMWKVGFSSTKHERACPYYK